MQDIHQRMPVIFMPGECNAWLANDVPLPNLIAALTPREYKDMEAYEVSRRVNNATTDISDLITPERRPSEKA
jgi:putative SOS response-associated peptidase YedK